MPVEGIALSSLNELKYRHGFPPRQSAAQIRGHLASRGLGYSSALAEQVAGVYLAVVEKVLDDFAERVFQQGAALGYATAQAMRQGIVDAHENLFDLTRGLVRDEIPGDCGTVAAATVDNRRIAVLQHLERKIELHALAASPTRALDPKLGILLSPRQLEIDLDARVAAARAVGNPVTVVFLALDDFKRLNARRAVLPEAQRLARKLIQGRGDVYLQGEDAMVMLAPNLDEDEARAFADKVRRSFENHKLEVDGEVVRVTISVGVATWPADGATHRAIVEAANRAYVEAARKGNAVVIAGGT